MKKLFVVAMVVALVFFGMVGQGITAQVTDDNNAKDGQILIADGAHKGTWTDPNTLFASASGLTTEIANRKTADTNLHLEVTGETANRVNGDTALQNNDLTLQSHINNESTNRMNADSAIQDSITNEANDRTHGDNSLQSNINNEALNRANADNTLQGNIDTEAITRANDDTTLQNNINTVDTNSIDRDNLLQGNVDTEATTRSNADTTLQNNINTVDNTQTNWNNRQDTDISNLNTTVNRQGDQINNLNKRVGSLEDTQLNVRGEVDFIREKNYTVGVYGKYNMNRNVCSEVGLAVTVGIGDSYMDREMTKLNAKLSRIETAMQKQNFAENVAQARIIKTKTATGYRIEMDKSGVPELKGKF